MMLSVSEAALKTTSANLTAAYLRVKAGSHFAVALLDSPTHHLRSRSAALTKPGPTIRAPSTSASMGDSVEGPGATSAAAVQPLHEHDTYHKGHQRILVIGETGSGKSTFIQYMMVRDIASIDSSKIQASVHSVTRGTHTFESPTVVIPNKGHFSATFVDTVGFNALDIDANRVFNELQEQVRFAEAIHKILIVHKLGRSRAAVVADTGRTIKLLERLGARPINVYVTITFAYDYNSDVRDRMRQEVQDLYRDHVQPENVFFSDYVLLPEIDEGAREHYERRIRRTHAALVEKMIVERVQPFKPLVNTLRELDSQSRRPHVRWAERTVFAVLIFLSWWFASHVPTFARSGEGFVPFFIFALVLPALMAWIAFHR